MTVGLVRILAEYGQLLLLQWFSRQLKLLLFIITTPVEPSSFTSNRLFSTFSNQSNNFDGSNKTVPLTWVSRTGTVAK